MPATWTGPTTRVTGELITDAKWNTDIVNNLLFLYNVAQFSAIANKTTTYAAVQADSGTLITADASGAGFTITLPQISTLTLPFVLTIFQTSGGANAVTLARSGSDTINGATSLALNAKYSAVILTGTGTTWDALLINGVGTSAQGDIMYRDANGWTRLAAGSSGNFLKTQGAGANPVWAAPSGSAVDSGLSGTTTLIWDNKTADKNLLLNGDFAVAQLGTTFSASGYTLDQWLLTLGSGASATLTQQSFTIGQPLGAGKGEPRYFLQLAVGTAGSGATTIDQPIESVRPAAAQQVTLSFWAKASAGTPTLNTFIRQNFGTGGSPSGNVDSATQGNTLSTSWQKFTQTVTLGDIVGKTIGSNGDDRLEVFFSCPTSNGAVTYAIADVQIELGGTASSFARQTYQREWFRCSRYLQVYGGVAANDIICAGFANATTTAICSAVFPVEMRSVPSLSLSAASDWQVYNGSGGGQACTALSLTGGQTSKKTAALSVTVASGLTTNQGTQLLAVSSSARMKFDARY